MNNQEYELSIRRILVALDASPSSLAALQAGARLAAIHAAELLGLFVEDVNLFRLAQLPFAREVRFWSQRRRELDPQYVERQLRAQARRIQRVLERHAEQAEVNWSFRVARGTISRELLEAATEADLIVLGKTGLSLHRGRRLGSTARAVLLRADRQTLILPGNVRLSLPVLVLYDGSPLAHRALMAAVDLVREQKGELVLLLLAQDPDTARELKGQLEDLLREQELNARYHWVSKVSAQELVRLVGDKECGLLVLPTLAPELRGEALSVLLEKLNCPVLLVR